MPQLPSWCLDPKYASQAVVQRWQAVHAAFAKIVGLMFAIATMMNPISVSRGMKRLVICIGTMWCWTMRMSLREIRTVSVRL
ncbi:hypothetical protein BDW62DRAFT_191948 [Aspergillus aurantiobrunneus]